MTDTFSDILAILAMNGGACLYWQMPDPDRAQAAARTGVVKVNGDLLIHPDAIEIEAGMYYEMPK